MTRGSSSIDLEDSYCSQFRRSENRVQLTEPFPKALPGFPNCFLEHQLRVRTLYEAASVLDLLFPEVQAGVGTGLPQLH